MPTPRRRPWSTPARISALATLVLGAGLLATPGPVRAVDPLPLPAGVTRLPTTVTFYGRGYGHGVGMSQHGARGRALAGQTAATILAHYYRGTALGSIATSTPIRVLVLSGFRATAAAPLVVVGRGGSWTIDSVTTPFPADARLLVIPTVASTSTGSTTTWRLRVDAPDGTVLYEGPRPTTLRVRPAASATILQLDSKPGSYDRYAGVLRIVAASTASVVNEIGLERYLRGVVPVEMPATWPGEALKAQAIAARSYAARRLHPTTGTWDVKDDTSSQVYHGVLGERAATNRAITATAGKVLKYGSAVANTLFHSTGGGATESNQNVFVSSTGAIVASPVPYLRGSSDRAANGVSYDAGAPYATWKMLGYPRTRLSTWFAADARTNVGALAGLDLRNRGVSGRLISVTLYGSTGSKRVAGDVFRSILNAARPAADPMLRSTLFALAPIPGPGVRTPPRGPAAAGYARAMAAFDARPRCPWALGQGRPDPLMVAYHDDEWGVPVDDD
ncbi:MAG: SpoIID/LytB domain-containing protein, partial [Chloroflexota bacterium]